MSVLDFLASVSSPKNNFTLKYMCSTIPVFDKAKISCSYLSVYSCYGDLIKFLGANIQFQNMVIQMFVIHDVSSCIKIDSCPQWWDILPMHL